MGGKHLLYGRQCFVVGHFLNLLILLGEVDFLRLAQRVGIFHVKRFEPFALGLVEFQFACHFLRRHLGKLGTHLGIHAGTLRIGIVSLRNHQEKRGNHHKCFFHILFGLIVTCI